MSKKRERLPSAGCLTVLRLVCVVVIVNDVMMSKSLIFSQRASSDIDIQHEPDKSYLLSFFFCAILIHSTISHFATKKIYIETFFLI